MKKGFLAIVMVFALLPLLYESLEGYRMMENTGDIAENVIILRQRINERLYDLENGFVLTVRKELGKLRVLEIDNDERTVLVCSAIRGWAGGFKDVGFYVGYVRKEDYENVEVFGLENCEDFLFADREHAEVVENNQELRKDVLGNWAVAFVFKFKVYKADVKVLIPESTVIR